MNISYNWLKDLIDINVPADELGQMLTRVGLAVEGVHQHGDDQVFDIDLTSNRPDCLSHLGVAREIGVMTGARVKLSEPPVEPPVPNILAWGIVRIDDNDLCHRFTARIIRNVKIGRSPEWLVSRLEAIGERSINNVADITNYVMHELGQPMHSFDLDKLAGSRIIVRRAKQGETITTLDEMERKLDTDMLAICDAEKPVAVAGVMGGFESSITDSTVNVLLEVAYFKRENIRYTSRKLNLATEASYRFERGVDIENLVRASSRATELICELAGGEKGEFVDVYPTRAATGEIHSADISAAVKRLTGLEVERDECIRILNALGIESEAEATVFTAPSWRHDIGIEEDLIEEVARHTGYENIANELPPAFGAGEYQPTEPREKQLRSTLTAIGFNESLAYSFIDTRFDGVFETAPGLVDADAAEPYVTLQDSVIEGAVRMRPTLLPGLLDAVRLNLNHQQRNVKLFEIGKAFAASTEELPLPNEQKLAGLIVTGGETHAERANPGRELDLYDAKGAVEAALEAAGVRAPAFTPAEVKHLRPGRSAAISIDGDMIGYIGQLNDEIAAKYKFRQPVFVAEINLQTVLQRPAGRIIYEPLAKFPGIIRDVSFVGPRTVSYAEIENAVLEQNFELCRSITFVDVYEGKGIAADERSITIRLEYRSDERTLVEDEVESIHTAIVSRVQDKLGIKVRV